MHHIVYLSTATVPLTEADLYALLRHFSANNARHQVTGLLLYSDDGHFLQVIEGEHAVLRNLFAAIQVDARHRDVLTLADGPIEVRHFSAWLMGFRVSSTAAFAQLAGYVEPASPTFQHALATADAGTRSVLATFVCESAPRIYLL